MGGNMIGLLGTIIAATSHHVKTLIGGSALIGIAGAVQLSFPVIIGELVPNKHRPYANGAMYVFALPVSSFGPVIARSFILHTKAGWRWSYYINIIFTFVVVVLLFFFYHPPTLGMLHAKGSKRPILKMLDIGGVFLFGSGLLVFLLGISWGGQQYPWKSGPVIGTIVGGAVLLALLVIYGLSVLLNFSGELD
jgi:MFS family permease